MVLAFITAAAICLLWGCSHGAFVLVLFTVAVNTAAVIYLVQRTRSLHPRLHLDRH
jgi:hypothetical protein